VPFEVAGRNHVIDKETKFSIGSGVNEREVVLLDPKLRARVLGSKPSNVEQSFEFLTNWRIRM